MLGIFSISLIFTIFQVVTSQIPQHCMGPPPGVVKPGDCCKIPPMFSEEDFKECGIENPRQEPRGPPDCTKHICLMKRYNLMKDDENIDKDAVDELLNKFADDNPEFKDAMQISKEKCLSDGLPGPPYICEATRLGICIMMTTFHECPTWEDSDNCKKLKDHMDECRAYFPK
ncbi:general odorant-binding protein 68-like isoform X2 [Maniola hyperantus]|uniref:general odorant-binding protein 68-like isoform X2 n=1 Tax=Aphantopus hyperantus TaxID=2795564 RepID=UPI001567EF86|nr:uncharacterized protein LOC117986406 isoform X2 [Maniola hyperantus]